MDDISSPPFAPTGEDGYPPLLEPFNVQSAETMFDIEKHLHQHPYDVEDLEPVHAYLKVLITQMDPPEERGNDSKLFQSFGGGKIAERYGLYLEKHLERTASMLGAFLRHLGYEESIATRVQQAFKSHDVGKTHISQKGLWVVTEGKQTISDDVKQERMRHAMLGAEVIQATYRKIVPYDTKSEYEATNQIAGVTLAKYLASYHHERMDGQGPNKLKGTELCPILRAAIIVDAFDGKRKVNNDHTPILTQMSGEKHAGQFDKAMLEKFAEFVPQYLGTRAPVNVLPQP